MIFEIILFVLGAAFLIVSFFIGNEKNDAADDKAAFTFPKEQLEAANTEVLDTIRQASENTLIEAENKLSSMSNETIMFVDDFAKQTFERIQHNHDEVVFMYNMLQEKEEALKTTERNILIEQEKLEEQKKELEAMLSPKMSGESGIEIARRKSQGERAQKKDQVEPAVPAFTPEPETQYTIKPEFDDGDEESNTQKILELYGQKKSVLEISKLLGIGQGEVKLVIDLYGR